MASNQADWERYGRALHRAMAEVIEEFPEDARPHALETAATGSALGSPSGWSGPTRPGVSSSSVAVSPARATVMSR
jgi:hypothetical protein